MQDKSMTTIANRDSKRVRNNRKKAPCVVFTGNDQVVLETQARIDRELELLALQRPQ